MIPKNTLNSLKTSDVKRYAAKAYSKTQNKFALYYLNLIYVLQQTVMSVHLIYT